MGKLDGKVAIITGASRGIGKDMAIVFGREGAQVVVSARTMDEGDFRIPGAVNTTVDKIRAAGGAAIGIRADVTNEEEVQALVDQTVAEFGRVDILVNNAAILVPGGTLDMQMRHFDLQFRVNVRGPIICLRAVLPQMIKQQYGHIINISSGGAIGPGAGPYPAGQRGGGSSYGAGKAFIERYSQGLAAEVNEHNIAVNVLSPDRGIATEGQRWFGQQGGGGRGRSFAGSRENGEIMGAAAVVICNHEPQTYTGHILYDEPVLREAGVRDFSQYPVIRE